MGGRGGLRGLQPPHNFVTVVKTGSGAPHYFKTAYYWFVVSMYIHQKLKNLT